MNEYEAYTIHKMFHHTSHRERQACSKRLSEHFQFLAAFECQRLDLGSDSQLGQQHILDTVEALWNRAVDAKPMIKNKIYESIASIVTSLSVSSCRNLNAEITKSLMKNEDYKHFLKTHDAIETEIDEQ